MPMLPMLFETFQPPWPFRRVAGFGGGKGANGVVDSAPPSPVSPEKPARRFAQDDGLVGGLNKNIAHKLTLLGRSPSQRFCSLAMEGMYGKTRPQVGTDLRAAKYVSPS
jgi:hypothetical protein